MKPSRVDVFLQKVGAELRAERLRRDTIDELKSHLEDAIEGLRQRGLPAEEAEELAVYQLGDPRELGRKIRRANRPYYARFSFLAAAGLLIGLPAAFAGVLWFEQNIRADLEADAREKDRYEKEFLEDQRVLAASDFFGDVPKNERDAGVFLNGRVEWSGVAQYDRPFRDLEFSRDAQKIFRFAKRENKEWYELALAPFVNVKTDWIAELQQYDHWDLLTGASPAMGHLQRGEAPQGSPVPDFGAFQDFAKVRFLRAFAKGDLLPALREVRHLAKLVYSTEVLIGPMIALGILAAERKAYEEGVRRGLIRASAWRPVDEDTALRARRALYSSSTWLGLGNSPEQVTRILSQPHSASGLCAGIQELSFGLFYARSFLAPKVIGETDYGPRIEYVKRLVNESPGCRNSLAKSYWEKASPEPVSYPFAFSSDPIQLGRNLGYSFGSYIPYLRRPLGLMLLRFGTLSAIIYERGPKPKRAVSSL